jgi:hypothetical protein
MDSLAHPIQLATVQQAAHFQSLRILSVRWTNVGYVVVMVPLAMTVQGYRTETPRTITAAPAMRILRITANKTVKASGVGVPASMRVLYVRETTPAVKIVPGCQTVISS